MLTFSSCTRDPIITPTPAGPFLADDHSSFQGDTRWITGSSVPHVVKKVKKMAQKYATRTESTLLEIDSVYTDYLRRSISSDSLLTVYSMFVGGGYANAFFNLYIEEDSAGNLSAPLILMYAMDSTFALEFRNGEKDMTSFVGTILQMDMEDAFSTPLQRGGEIDIQIIKRCVDIVYFNTNPGSGVIFGPNNSTLDIYFSGGRFWVSQINPGGGTGGGDPDPCYITVCGCDPQHLPGIPSIPGYWNCDGL